jgi:cation diffusion facilitator CzcD-associated flavoprotein CzcO
VAAAGGLTRPALPAIPGLAGFRGRMFHSAQWDHGYDLEGKDVALIGTGASAIQIVPRIAGKVRHLYLYQRTPPWILPRADRAIRPWQQALYRYLPPVQALLRLAIYWKLESRGVAFVVRPGLMRWAQKLALRHLERQVADPALRLRLTPHYTMGCKRVLLADDYYPALQRPNVELITAPITALGPDGVECADARGRPADAVILATGFDAADAGPPFPIRGRGGVTLDRAWSGGAEAYLGTSVAGFPNLYFLVGPNTGLGHNSMVSMIESQVGYVLSCMRHAAARGIALEVRPQVQARYNRELQDRLAQTVWNAGCASWYRSRSGRITTLWPGFAFEFRWRTHRLDPDDYLERAAAPERSV